MSQIYAGESHSCRDKHSFLPGGSGIGWHWFSYGQLYLTVQETINIVPRTINLIPFVNLGELDLFPSGGEEQDYTRLEGALLIAFDKTAGSPR